MEKIQENIDQVEARIAAACEAAGRSRDEVTLVAVSKKQPVTAIRVAADFGLTVFGENRVQEAMVKMPELPGGLTWHLIGHLQTNKVRHVIHAEFALIHSVDSERLLLALEQEAETQGKTQPILLQVNVSGEGSKFGVAPGALPGLLEVAAGCTHLEVEGLMTMPPFTEDPEKAGPHFARLRTLRDEVAVSSGFPLQVLSMGMSHDLEIAIREGATMVRVGTDLFGTREKA